MEAAEPQRNNSRRTGPGIKLELARTSFRGLRNRTGGTGSTYCRSTTRRRLTTAAVSRRRSREKQL